MNDAFDLHIGEIRSYRENPKTMTWMADFLLERYEGLGFQLQEQSVDSSQVVPEAAMDIKLSKGEIQGITLSYTELFLVVAARKILQAQAARSYEEITADKSGTGQQGLAHQAQKEAYVYVNGLRATELTE